MEHWSTPYLEHLIRRGIIPDPSPLHRPWRAGDLAQALEAVRLDNASSAEVDMIERLRPYFSSTSDSVTLWLEADAGLRSSTHARFNSELREAGHGLTSGRIGANSIAQFKWLTFGHHPVWDPNMEHDLDWGGRSVPITIRYEQVYVTARSRYAAVDFGRVRRNWGPVGFPGLVVSSNPYPFDQLSFDLGTRRLNIRMLVAQIDDKLNNEGELSQRFWVAHRVGARIGNNIDLGIWESSIISGPGQQLELWFVNPIAVQFQGEDEEQEETNVLLGGDGEFRILPNLRLSGSVIIDDLQWVNSGSKTDEPPSYAFTGVLDWSIQTLALSLGYTQVSNLAYRTHEIAETFITDENPDRGGLGVGLARTFSDYDQLTLKVGLFAIEGLLIEPEATVLRQGEGDLRQPFPPPEDNPITPTIFAGNVETTFRLACRADYAHPSGLRASLSAGWHHINDLHHVEGVIDDKFVATIQIRFMFNRAWPLTPAGIR